MRSLLVLATMVLASGCIATRPVTRVAPAASPATPRLLAAPPNATLVAQSSQRVARLKSLGQICATYASVLESSLSSGRVTVRPYMWRVDGRLVSGEARTDGTIVVALHIDSLNVGVRTMADVVQTLEHEAAHMAFRITNGRDVRDDSASAVVRECRTN